MPAPLQPLNRFHKGTAPTTPSSYRRLQLILVGGSFRC